MDKKSPKCLHSYSGVWGESDRCNFLVWASDDQSNVQMLPVKFQKKYSVFIKNWKTICSLTEIERRV